jgi:hypothetical protein
MNAAARQRSRFRRLFQIHGNRIPKGINNMIFSTGNMLSLKLWEKVLKSLKSRLSRDPGSLDRKVIKITQKQ